MHRVLVSFALCAGLMGWALLVGDAGAQSQKKRTGPVVALDGLKSQTFDYWKAGKAAKPDLYRFNFPKADSDKSKEAPEMVITPFTSSSEDLIESWKKSFVVPEGKKLDFTTKQLKAGSLPVTYVEIYGTYLKKDKPDDPDEKATQVKPYRLVGGIIETKQGKYQARLVGGSPTVGQIIPDFQDWLKNFK